MGSFTSSSVSLFPAFEAEKTTTGKELTTGNNIILVVSVAFLLLFFVLVAIVFFFARKRMKMRKHLTDQSVIASEDRMHAWVDDLDRMHSKSKSSKSPAVPITGMESTGDIEKNKTEGARRKKSSSIQPVFTMDCLELLHHPSKDTTPAVSRASSSNPPVEDIEKLIDDIAKGKFSYSSSSEDLVLSPDSKIEAQVREELNSTFESLNESQVERSVQLGVKLGE